MALSNRDRIQRGLDLLRAGLEPFVVRELKARLKGQWADAVQSGRRYELEKDREGNLLWDNYALLSVMLDEWRDVFGIKLGPSHRTLVHELREVRNRWAHDKPFSTDATYRALDSMKLLLDAVSAQEQASEVEKHAHEVLRTKFAERKTNTRQATRKKGKLGHVER